MEAEAERRRKSLEILTRKSTLGLFPCAVASSPRRGSRGDAHLHPRVRASVSSRAHSTRLSSLPLVPLSSTMEAQMPLSHQLAATQSQQLLAQTQLQQTAAEEEVEEEEQVCRASASDATRASSPPAMISRLF